MKARRRVVPGMPPRRTPTVRRIKPAITPVSRGPRVSPGVARPDAGASDAAGGAIGTGTPAVDLLGGRPVALEVDLGRGLVLPNPVIAAAGPFGYGAEYADLVDLDRLGGIVTRGTTLKPRGGHAPPRTVEVSSGLLNGIGMHNPGIDVVLDRYAQAWASWPAPVILNLCAESVGDMVECVRRLEGVPGVAGIEVNLSCAGGRGGAMWGLDEGSAGSLVAAVRRATELPVIAKLTPAAADVRAIAHACEDAGADVISAINTLPGLSVAADRLGLALGSGYGGISGPALKPVALRVVYEVAQVVDVPVIGMGGVVSIEDVLDLLAVGAVAVGVGVAVLADPMLPVRLADELADACRARGLASVGDLVGTALPARTSAPSTKGAEYAR